MGLARKILGNTVSQVAGRFLTAFLAVVVVKILTVYLGQSGYGQYATIYEFLAFFGAFADFGIFTIAVREMSRTKKNEEVIFANTLTLRTMFTATAMLAAAGVAFLIPQYQGTVIPLGVAIAALSTFFVILSGTLSAALQIRLRMEMAAIGLVIGKVLTVLAIVFLTQNLFPDSPQKSFYYLIWAGSLGAGVTFLITLFVTRRIFPVAFRFDIPVIRSLLIESAPFAIALALNTLYVRMDILLLSLLLPPSIDGKCLHEFCSDTEVGMYAVGARILEILLMVPIYFMNSVLPSLTRSIEEKSKNLLGLLQKSFLFLFAVGLPSGILLFLLARETAALISTASFLSAPGVPGSDTALQILSGMIPLAFCSIFFGFLLIASGKQKILIWINLLAVLFNIVIDFWAIPHYGFVGAAGATVLSEGVMLSLMILFTIRVVKFVPQRGYMMKIFFSAVIAGGVSWLIHSFVIGTASFLILLIVTTVFFALYFALLWKLQIITPALLHVLRKKTGASEMKDELL